MNMELTSLRVPAWFDRWRAVRTPSERRIVIALAVLVAVTLGWIALWQPLQRDRELLRTTVPAERAALAQAQKMADEMAALARVAPAPPSPDPRALLERMLGERGLRAAVTQLDWRDDRARIVFADIGVEPLVALVDALSREAQLRIVEMTLTARVEPGAVRAEFTLAH